MIVMENHTIFMTKTNNNVSKIVHIIGMFILRLQMVQMIIGALKMIHV